MRWKVTDREGGEKLLDFLRKKYPDRSGKSIKRALDHRSCLLNGKLEMIATTRLKSGDWVECTVKEPLPCRNVQPLWEDEDILAVDKPSGIACEPCTFAPHILVHRLDKETSGVLLLAKNEAAFEALSQQFRNRSIHKEYLAVVEGHMPQEKGVIEVPLGKKSYIQGQTLYGPSRWGKSATTHWKCLQSTGGISLLSCKPVTGRTHQLRVHLQSIGHPIIGDALYGKQTFAKYEPPRLLLHARRLRFYSRTISEELEIIAPVAEELSLFLAQKGLHFGQGKGVEDIAFF